MPDHTPLLGVPFPLPEDALVDYPALGAELAEKIELVGGPLVTELPPAPVDGQEVSYLIPSLSPAVAVPGVWRLRYRAGADPFPWEFLGGAPLFDEYPEVFEAIGWGFGTFGPAPSGRPYLIIPLAGDYLVRAIAHAVVPIGSTAAMLSVSPPFGITTTGEGRGLAQVNAAGPVAYAFGGEKVHTLALGNVLPFIARMTFPGFQAAATNGIQYGEKRLYATPIRVGLG